MILEVITTPRETLVSAPTDRDAEQLRRQLTTDGHLVLDADPSDLDHHSLIPEGEYLETATRGSTSAHR